MTSAGSTSSLLFLFLCSHFFLPSSPRVLEQILDMKEKRQCSLAVTLKSVINYHQLKGQMFLQAQENEMLQFSVGADVEVQEQWNSNSGPT